MTEIPAHAAAVRRAAVIFDRDGVLNVDTDYTWKVEDLTWMPGAREAVARLNRAGVMTAVATNQSGVARGYYTENDVHAFHAAMAAGLAEIGARIDAWYLAPFHEKASVERYHHPDHPDRKPNPGMLLRAIGDLLMDPARTLMIGDRDSDVEAARRAGVHGALYRGGDLEAFLVEKLAAIGVTI